MLAEQSAARWTAWRGEGIPPRRVPIMNRPLALLGVVLALLGCGRRAPNATPDGAVRELVELMRRVYGDPGDAKAAYGLLSLRARQNLTARSQRYSAASGKAITPEAMIAPSRFVLRFQPERYSAQIWGSSALVDVIGIAADEHTQVPCVLEDGVWRVDLTLPPLPPVQTRPGGSQP
jgi:hypothetical protein